MSDSNETRVFKLTDDERTRLGLKKPPRGALTTKVVYPVHSTSRSMYYQTSMIPLSELPQYLRDHPGLVVVGKSDPGKGGRPETTHGF